MQINFTLNKNDFKICVKNKKKISLMFILMDHAKECFGIFVKHI
jgi:hypothetical protein